MVACAAVLAVAAVLVAVAGFLCGRGGAAADHSNVPAVTGTTALAHRPASGPHDAPAPRAAGPGCPSTPPTDRATRDTQTTPRTPPPASPVDRARALFRILDPKGCARAEQPGALLTTGQPTGATPTAQPADVAALLAQIRALPANDPAAAAFARQVLLDSTVASVRLAALRRLEGIPDGLSVDLLERVVAAGPLAGAEGIPAVAAYQVLLKAGDPAAAQAVERLRARESDPARKKILSQLASVTR